MSNKELQSRVVHGFTSGARGIAMGVTIMLLAIALAVPAALTVAFFWPLFPVMVLLPMMSGHVPRSLVAVDVPQMEVTPPSLLLIPVMA